MTEEVLEMAARAAAIATNPTYHETHTWEDLAHHWKNHYRKVARAVLAAAEEDHH
jgi:hypothetical protein